MTQFHSRTSSRLTRQAPPSVCFQPVDNGLASDMSGVKERGVVIGAHDFDEAQGEIAGYAYAGPYRPRPAYRFTVEDSVYLASGMAGRGIGHALRSAWPIFICVPPRPKACSLGRWASK